VRLIRAEHIAAMVSDAVHTAIKESGLIDPDEHERLVERSRAEFQTILREREREAQHARDVEERLQARERELVDLKHRLEELATALSAARAEADRAREQAEASQGAAPAGMPASGELLMTLFQEMATLKAGMAQQVQQAAPQASGDLTAALDKLTSSLNDRLESFGKKMGISAAVESDVPTDLSGLFKGADQVLESNMDDVKIKQRAGGGIAANLARLKKLKGGG